MHKASLRLLFLGLAGLLLACQPPPLGQVGAPAGGGGSRSAGGEVSGRCGGDFGTSEAAAKLETFMSAQAAFATSASDLDATLRGACKKMGKELGIDEKELSGDMRTACTAVSNTLRTEFSTLRASAKLKVSVMATPPRCEVSMDAYAKCEAGCTVDVKPGKVDLKCEGGEIVGRCEGSCKGECTVDAHGSCQGSCEGSCSAGCKGTCNGVCDGKCSAKNAKGECVGKCDGQCHGTCSLGCSGECSGECSVKAKASCEGECHGGCSVEYDEPRCTGEVRAPSASADCRASCDARVNAEARCEPGTAKLVVKGNVKTDAAERVAKLSKAIDAAWGDFVSAEAKVKRVAKTGEALVNASVEVPGAVGTLGAGAIACAAQAAVAVPRAMAQVSASVDVSVSLSASVSASAK